MNALFLIALVSTPGVTSAAQPAQRVAVLIDSFVAHRIDSWLDYYKDLHANPELSSHEEATARKIADGIEKAGYTVTRAVGGHGVVGLLKNGSGPTILIRGDMDALPIAEETDVPYGSKVRVMRDDGTSTGVMHACGHDIHQTCLLGTAQLLANHRDAWQGTVMIIAQPAEEIGTGARLMLEDGLFERFGTPDYCIALHVSASHPTGTVSYTPGWALANVDSVDITIFGRGGHGSQPHKTIDPIVAAAQTVVALQTIVSRRVDPIDPAVITVGSFHAGFKHNIISDRATLQLTVRSYTEEVRRILLDGIRDITIKTCRAMGCARDPEIIVREDEFTPSTYNDPKLTERAAALFRSLLGQDRVVPQKPVMGGEDFGRFPKESGAPGLIFWLGSVEANRYAASLQEGGQQLPSLHSSKYAPDPRPTIETGVKCLASLAITLLESGK